MPVTTRGQQEVLAKSAKQLADAMHSDNACNMYMTPQKTLAPRKLARTRSDLAVLEGQRAVHASADKTPQEAVTQQQQQRKKQRGRTADNDENHEEIRSKRLKGGGVEISDALWARLPSDFSTDYFAAAPTGRLQLAGLEEITSNASVQQEEQQLKRQEQPFTQWLSLLRLGFTVLVEGAGSKRNVLEAFVDEKLMPWGAVVVRMEGYAARFPTAECLREVLARVHPTAPRVSKTFVEAAANALAAARSQALAAEATSRAVLRPLCLVVHSLDALPLSHQAALARLAATAPRLHIVASVDSIWSPLQWTASVSKDFNFCRVKAHTHELYEVEAEARYLGSLPGWADPAADKRRGPRTSLSLVLRSLTNNHRELVQAIAEHQMEVGRSGISRSALLTVATERMIARNATKLKGLVNELKDHEVVIEKSSGEGDVLYVIPYDDKTLTRLADGDQLDEEEDGQCADVAAAIEEGESEDGD